MADWNKASDEIMRGLGPESREWAIRQMVADFPNRGGVPDRSRENAERIVDAMLGVPFPWMTGWAIGPDDILCAYQVAEYASKEGFLYREGKAGWLTREGELLSCAYAAHEKLLHSVLKMTASEAEALGWARVHRMKWDCRFRLSAAQKAALRNLDLVVDPREERAKPELPPAEASQE